MPNRVGTWALGERAGIRGYPRPLGRALRGGRRTAACRVEDAGLGARRRITVMTRSAIAAGV
ncbi:MAG: hypothetical protein M1118_08980 [Chloroflexi bacterium]|nr:hypothetical protein [Chloroflexota bacterium]